MTNARQQFQESYRAIHAAPRERRLWGLRPAIRISNRLMIMASCMWFAVAAWGRARHAS